MNVVNELRKVIGVFILAILIFFSIVYLNKVYDHQVRQEVTVNNYSDHRYDYYPTPRFFNETDSVGLARYTREMRIHDKCVFSPYKLTTTYNHHSVTDYGDAKEIDSLKCIRYNEMVVDKAEYDAMDIANEKQIEEFDKAEEAKEAELDKLNKSCD